MNSAFALGFENTGGAVTFKITANVKLTTSPDIQF